MDVLLLNGLALVGERTLNRCVADGPDLVGQRVDHGSRVLQVALVLDIRLDLGCDYQTFRLTHSFLLVDNKLTHSIRFAPLRLPLRRKISRRRGPVGPSASLGYTAAKMRLIVFTLNQEELLERVLEAYGRLTSPGTGVLYSIPVDFAVGLVDQGE